MKHFKLFLMLLAFTGLSMTTANAEIPDLLGDYSGSAHITCEMPALDVTFDSLVCYLKPLPSHPAENPFLLEIAPIDVGGGTILPAYQMPVTIGPDYHFSADLLHIIIPEVSVSGIVLKNIPATIELVSGWAGDNILSVSLVLRAYVFASFSVYFNIDYIGNKTDVGFGGGDGTEQNPYLIYTAGQLKYLADFVNSGGGTLSKYYKLMNHLDLSVYSYGAGWKPIGNYPISFEGHFDGNKKEITGLKINIIPTKGTTNIGLFGYCAYGSIKNLGIHNADITVTGKYEPDWVFAGCLVGFNYSNISNCYSTGKITIIDGNQTTAGGLVGQGGPLTNCFSTVEVSSNNAFYSNTGGLVGTLGGGQTVSNCYASGNVSDYVEYTSSLPNGVGGLVGHMFGELVAGKSAIKDCAALNKCIWGGEQSNVGRIVGTNDTCLLKNNIALNSMKYICQMTNYWTKIGLDKNDGANYDISSLASDGTLGGRFTTAGGWIIKNGVLPKLCGKNFSYIPLHLWMGDGTKKFPYLVSIIDHLYSLAEIVNAGGDTKGLNFKLTGNIVMEKPVPGSPGNWIPIGCPIGPRRDVAECPFQGAFDGNNHKITGIVVQDFAREDAGLFGYTVEATIENLILDDCNIIGKDNAGSFVGEAKKTKIRNCKTVGRVATTRNYAGGLIGRADESEISECAASCRISGSGERYGGLVGYCGDKAKISNCFATGEVISQETYVGGLVGECGEAEISYCYSTGKVTGDEFVGGLVGYCDNATIQNCVALNDSVIATTSKACRVIGHFKQGVKRNNYAIKNMVLVSDNSTPSEGDCGSDISIELPWSHKFYVNKDLWYLGKVWDIDLGESRASSKWYICDGTTLPLIRGLYDSKDTPCRPVNITNPDATATQKIAIYPNPTNGELRITNGDLKIDNVEIFDVFGKMQNTESRIMNNELHLNLSNLATGIYFIRIQTEQEIVTQKVIKQ